MAIKYMVQAQKDGVGLRRIAIAVESLFGFKLTHAGVDKILKRDRIGVAIKAAASTESKQSARVSREFQPGDVVEFDESKWFKCGDWGYGSCFKFTQDPKAAGWHESEWSDGEWECEACWQKDFFRLSSVSYKSGKAELTMGDKSRIFTKAELAKLIKALEAEKKPTKKQKIELSLFKEWLKGVSQNFNSSHSCGSGMRLNYEDQKKIKAKDSELLELQYELLNFDPSTLPPIPETIKL